MLNIFDTYGKFYSSNWINFSIFQNLFKYTSLINSSYELNDLEKLNKLNFKISKDIYTAPLNEKELIIECKNE